MKKLTVLTLFFLAFSASLFAGDTLRTSLRIMLPADKQGWKYYLSVDGSGKPAIELTGREVVLNTATVKKSQQAYIYAYNADKSRQTNRYSINLWGKPTFIVVQGNNGVVVRARQVRMAKYSALRLELPEAERAIWK